MVITTSQKRLHLHNNVFNQTYNSDILKNVKNDKVLGVFIDKNLTWPIHMQSIAKKISSNLWLLSKLKEFFSRENKVHFYKTYIQPHTDYCSTVWGETSHSSINRIYGLQQNVRIILGYEYTDIACSMNELKTLNISERIFLRSPHLILIICSPSEQYIKLFFNQISKYIKFSTPRPHKEIFKQCFIYSGPVIWNNLPDW